MTKYYCPYCSSRYQIHLTDENGQMVCGHCGDPLVKIRLITSKQIFALIAAIAFLMPLLAMVVFFFQETNFPKPQKSLPSKIFLFKRLP